MALYKKPRTVGFIKPEEMPRTTKGKILRRKQKKRSANLTEIGIIEFQHRLEKQSLQLS